MSISGANEDSLVGEFVSDICSITADELVFNIGERDIYDKVAVLDFVTSWADFIHKLTLQR
jgi:hypothetical protein